MGQHTATPLAALPRIRRSRAALCSSTALQAAALVVLAAPAHAQLAPTARPTGGQVSAGQASIGGNATTTTINQSSQKAAINWQTYNVGSGQTVQYNQPNASSFTLNRVIAAQPSQIAGHIKANGQIAIVNQSGVVFLQGSTVDTAGLVVSAAGITDADFMAGRMVFGAPATAGATVSNAGNITIRQAGLAALVAPQVRNSGTITAQLGRVILGGATTHTLDMYGDGLVALNVTGQVTQVQVAGHPVAALVTNTGTILAPGGTVVLTARAADGVVTTAVSAGGTIAAPTAGARTGRVLVSGIGGDVEVDGAISATGSNAAGGQIAVASDHHVTVAGGALLDASGDTAGGTLAIGTTAPVIAGPATIATATTVAPAATIRARAWRAGHGGRIAIASTGTTSVQGAVTAQGGDLSGDGGSVNLSGAGVDLPGAITTKAAHGLTGILGITGLGSGAPLYIGDACTGGKACTSYETIANAVLDNTINVSNAGNIDFLFNHAASVNGLNISTPALALNITTTAIAGHSSDVNFDAGVGIIVPLLNITSAGAINLNTTNGSTNASTGASVLDAPVSMTLSAANDILAGATAPNGSDKGELITTLLAITGARNVQLDAANNSIATLAGISDTAAATAISGTVTLIDNHSLSVTAPISATGSVSISVTGTDTLTGANSLFIPATSRSSAVSLSGAGITLASSGGIAIGASANAGAGTLSFDAQGGDITASGALTAGTLAAHATGNVSVTSAANAFATIGSGSGTVTGLVSDKGSVIVDDAVALAIQTAITAKQIALSTSGGSLTIAGNLTATGTLDEPGTISVHAGLGDILLQSTLQAGTPTAGIFDGSAVLQAGSGSITEAAGGAVHAGTLSASASGSIALAQSGNQIADLGRIGRTPFAVSAGAGISLTDGQNLNVAGLVSATGLLHLQIGGAAPSTLTLENDEGGVGTLSVSGAGTIALAADHFALNGGVVAHGGTVALDVSHAGTFKVADTGGTVDPTSLDNITAATLALGSQDGLTHGNTTNLLIDTGSALGPTVLDLTTVASTLALFASGAITEENPGVLPLGLSGISVGTVRGAAGGAVTLASSSNSIGTIAGLTSAAGSITVVDAASLAVTGAISAAGLVSLDVTPSPADFANVSTLTIGANVTGSNISLTSAAPSGALASLPSPTIAVQSGATIAAIGAGATPGTISLTSGIGNLSLAGTLSARTGSVTNGTISLTASGGSIVEQATGALQAGRLGASAARGTLASGATTGAGINLASGTTAAGSAPVNLVGTLTSLSAVDNIMFTDNTSLTVAGPIASSAGNIALAVDTQAGSAAANTLLIGATTLSGRSVALSTAGSATAAPATAITIGAGSTISTTGTPGTPSDHIGTLSVTAAQGAIAVNGTLTGVADGAAPYFGAIALDAATGGITEGSAGAIRASSFAAAAQTDIVLGAASGTLSGSPAGNQIAATGAPIGALSGIATQGSLTLVDGTPLSVSGLVSAGAQAAFVTPTLTLTGTGSLSVATGGKILIAANEYVLQGGITATDGLVALGLLTAGTFSVIAGTASGNDEIGAADLAHISAGTLALGTTDGFSADGNTASAATWTASTAGSVSLLQILAPLNSAFPTLGLFSNGAILATGSNSITATALYGAAATGIRLDSTSNQIGTLAALAHAPAAPQNTSALTTTLGDITLRDAHTLFAEGAVSAPGTVAITVTGLASAAAPNALHLDSTITGQTITLATTGSGATAASLPQIITFGANSSTTATGTLSVAAAQGDIHIAGMLQATGGGLTALRAQAGNIYETDAAFDAPSAATTPTGHILTGALAAQAGALEGTALYSVILNGGQNSFSDVAGFTTGATQVSSATDTFSLSSSLGYTVDAGVRVEAGNRAAGNPPSLLSLTANNGALTIDGTVQAGRLVTSSAGTAAYAGSLILQTLSDITEGAAAGLLAGTLTAASSHGGVLLDTAGATNIVAALSGLNTAATNYRLTDSAQVGSGVVLPGRNVNVIGSITANTGSLILKVAQGNLDLDAGAVLTAASSATLSADLGVLQNAGSVTAATIAITAGAEVAQFQGAHLTALGANGTAPTLAVTAGGGFANDVVLPGGGTITVFGIALGGTDVAASTSGHGAGSIVLTSPLGDISQASPTAATTTPPAATGTILADSLAFQAGSPGSASATAYNAWLNSAGNSISVLSGIAGTSSATGTILLTDTAGLTIATGTLIEAANAAGLPAALSIHDTASITIDGTLQAGALVSTNATTSAYTGALTLRADHGDITEDTAGGLLASSLNVNAASGNVALGATKNTVTSLVGSSSAFGNFAFADTARIATGIFLPGQNVFVTGPVHAGGSLALSVTGGNLNLEPGAILTAATTATLAADLGVLQFGGPLTAGTVAITAGAEFFQSGTASITSTGFSQSAPVAPSIAITASGGFANDVTLANGHTYSLYGITLGGVDTAGTPTGAGRTTLIATAGGITQSAPEAASLGALETGTLAFQAGSFESASPTLYSAILDGQNAIGTLSGLTFGGHSFAASSATGTIDLFDTTGLTIAANTRIEAGNTANLLSALTLNDTAGDLSILGTLQAGVIRAIDSTHGTYTGALTLHAGAGSITEGTAGALLGYTLNVSAPAGNVALTSAGNSVPFLIGTNTAGTNFTFQDNATLPGGLKLPHQDVTILNTVSANSGSLSLDVINGNLVLANAANLIAATGATLAADLGIVENPEAAITAGTVAINAGAEFAQFQGGAITATGFAATAPSIAITAGGGFANDVILSNGTTTSVFGIALGGSNEAFSSHAPGSIRLLSPAGDITEAAPGTPSTSGTGQLLTATLAFQAGLPGSSAATLYNAWLNNPVNHIGTITGITTAVGGTTTQLSGATGTLSVVDATALTVAATTVLEAANTTGHPTTATLDSLTGDLTLAGILSATSVTLQSDAGNVTQPTGTILAGTLTAAAGPLLGAGVTPDNITLTSATNAIGTLATSHATGSLSLLDSTGMVIAAGDLIEAANAAGLPDTLSLHTLAGTLSIAGTLQSGSLSAAGAYAGVTTLRADAGDITETAQGSVLSNTLNVNAPTGAISLASAGNVVTSLIGTNLAATNFTLTDEGTGLPSHNAFINGGITAGNIAVTITGGNLNLEPAAILAASGTATLSADLGILQFGGSVTAHAIGLTAGAEIAQFAGASLVGTPLFFQGHTFASSLTLQAGTKNTAAGSANDIVLPDGHTITLFGIALGGLDTATGQGVSAISLSTPGGDISQTAPNDATTGAPTTTPPVATGTLVTDILAFQAGSPGGPGTSNAWLNAATNRFGQLGFGTIGASREVDVVDTTDLTLDPAATLAAGGDILLTLTGHTLTQSTGDTLTAGGSATIDATQVGQAAGAVLTAAQNATITGALTQAAGASLTASSGNAAIGGTLSQTSATLIAGQSVTIGGAATQSGSTLAAGQSVSAAGDLTQNHSTLTAQRGSIAITGALTQTNFSLLDALAGAVSIGRSAAQDDSALLAATNAGIGGALTQANHGTLTATAGSVTIGGAATQALSHLTAGAGVSIGGTLGQTTSTLHAGRSVTIGGSTSQSASTLTASAGAVTIKAGGLNQSAASTLEAATSVSITGATVQSASLLTAGQGVSITGTVSQTASTLRAGQGVSATGDLTQNHGTITAQRGDIAIGGALTQTNASLLRAFAGAVSIGKSAAQDASALLAFTNVSIGGALTQADNSTLTATTGSISIGGNATQGFSQLTAGAGVSVTGTLGQATSTVLAGQSVVIGADATQSASSLTATSGSVTVGGSLGQSAGSTLAATAGRVGITRALSQTDSHLSAGAAISVGGSLAQTASTVLAGATVIVGRDATQSASTLTAQNAVIIRGALTQSADASLTAVSGRVTISGATTQDGSHLSAGTGVSIGGTLGQIASTLLAGQSVTIGDAATQAGSTLTATKGTVSIAGALAQSASLLAAGKGVSTGGGVTQSNGTLTAQTGDITITGFLTQTNASLVDALAGAVSVGGTAMQDASTVLAATNVGIGGALTQANQSTLTAAAGSVTIGGAATQALSQLTAGAGVSIGGTLSQTTASLVAGQSVSVTGDTTQSAGTLTAQAGDVTLGGKLAQSAGSALTASGAVAIAQSATQAASALTATSGSITIGGTLSQTTATLRAGQSVSVTGDTTQSAGTLTAQAGNVTLGGLLAQSAGSALTASGSVAVAKSASQTSSVLTASTGSVTIGGALSQATATLLAGQSVSVTGDTAQSAGTLTAKAGGITLGGTLTQSAASTLTAAGTVAITGNAAQSASLLTASLDARIGGSLAQTGSTLTAGQAVAIGGSLTQTASVLTAGAGISIGGLLAQSGSDLAAGQALTVGGDASQSASTLTAAGVSVTGSLTQSGSQFVSAGNIAVGGDATQSDGSTLTTIGSLESIVGALTVGGSLRQTDSQVALGGELVVGKSFAQDDSTLQAGFQIDRKGGQDITLSGAGSLTQSNGSTIISNAGIGAALSGGFTQDATSALYANGDIHLAATTGNIAFEGLVRAGQLTPLITLVARSGDIVSNAGTLNTGTLAVQASGNIVLNGEANVFGLVAPELAGTTQLAGLVAGGQLQLSDSTKLILQDATLSGSSVTLDAPGQTIVQQGGRMTANTGDLTMLAGNFMQDAGGTLSAIGGNLQISSPGTLSFAGLLEAPRILLGEHAVDNTFFRDTAAPAAIDFLGGTILTDSSIPIMAGAQPDVLAPITGGPDAALGLFATATNFTQTGTTAVHTLSGEARQTVQLRLTGPAGAIAFDPVFSTGSGFVGLTTQLLLDLGIKGYASGNIVVAGLNVYYGGTVNNQLGKASLTGSVNGRTGTAAASTGFIHTAPGVNYQFNACPIQSLNCVLLSPFVVPLGSPVRDLEVSVGHRREDDDDLILPNVAEQDY